MLSLQYNIVNTKIIGNFSHYFNFSVSKLLSFGSIPEWTSFIIFPGNVETNSCLFVSNVVNSTTNQTLPKTENRTSKPSGEAQRVGVRWKPDASAKAEWTWELQAERGSPQVSRAGVATVIRAEGIGRRRCCPVPAMSEAGSQPIRCHGGFFCFWESA